jgi:hypothetical protein
MATFHVLWAIFAVIAIVILSWAGPIKRSALIDDRGRYSLNRFQLLTWTIIIIPAFVALFFSTGLTVPDMSPELLGLLGIGAASAIGSGAVKNMKDVEAQEAQALKDAASRTLQQAKEDALRNRSLTASAASPSELAEAELAAQLKAGPSVTRAAMEPVVPHVKTDGRPSPGQMLWEEEGDGADKVISVSKFQSFLLTLVAGVAVVVMIAAKQTLALDFDQALLWLLGIGQGTYIAAKIPNK